MRSMTGYGHAEGMVEGFDFAIDVKTVNGRYLDVVTRLPRELAALEGKLKKRVQSMLKRGRVELYVSMTAQESDQFALNEALVDNYIAIARRAASRGIEGGLDMGTLLQLPGILLAKQVDFSSQQCEKALLELLDDALQGVVVERRDEGAALKKDLSERLQELERNMQRIEQGSTEVVDHYREKLSQRIEKLMPEQPADPARLAQEVIFYAEKADISEELTRLARHIKRFREQLEEGEGASVGKGLDFLCQEMNREANTILSKSQAGNLSDHALLAKTEVERIREQVQNVE